MNSPLQFLLVSAVATAVAAAQTPNPPAARTADQDWNVLVTLTSPPQSGNAPGQIKKTPAERNAEAQQRAMQARAASQAAREFHTNHPTHVHAPQARKLEALYGLFGVADDDKPHEQSAKQVAKAYRDNKSNGAADRFEVAVLLERVDARASLGGKVFGRNPAELEKIADRLLSDFEGLPEAFYFYASVARTADMERADRMAGKLLQSPAAPAEAKAEAQAIKDRAAQIGKALPVELRTTDGKVVNLAQQAGKLTIIYVWSASAGSAGLGGILPLKGKLPADAQIIYLGLGGAAEDLKVLEKKAPLPGVFSYDAVVGGDPAADRLKVRHTPYVYVLNRSGILHGFGPAADLSHLVAAANL